MQSFVSSSVTTSSGAGGSHEAASISLPEFRRAERGEGGVGGRGRMPPAGVLNRLLAQAVLGTCPLLLLPALARTRRQLVAL